MSKMNLRSQMAYIAAYSRHDIENKSPVELQGWALTIIDRANRALDENPAPQDHPVTVETVECVSFEGGYQEPADPIYRIVIDGYCADFETETGAQNFANSINSLISTPAPQQNVRSVCASCNGTGSRYVRHETGYASQATETCSVCAGTGFTTPHETEKEMT